MADCTASGTESSYIHRKTVLAMVVKTSSSCSVIPPLYFRFTCLVISLMSLVMKIVEMCIVISSGFALDSAGFSIATAEFFDLRLRLLLFCFVDALFCFSRLELDVAQNLGCWSSLGTSYLIF